MDNCKTYTGDNLKEALLQVKLDLGEEAKIADTREIEKNSFFGFFGESLVEVDAWLPESETQLDENSESRDFTSSKQRQNSNPGKSGDEPREWLLSEQNAPEFSPKDQATRLIEQKQKGGSDKTYSRSLDSSSRSTSSSAASAADTGSSPAKRSKSDRKITGLVEKTDLLQEKIDALTDKIESKDEQTAHETPHYPGQLSGLYTELVNEGVKREFVRQLIGRVRRMAEPDEFDAPGALEEHAREVLKEKFVPPASLDYDEKPVIIPFIGPTGVGKTTTLAKLAAQKIFENKSVGFISLDIYRLAAVDQLRCYANILEVPMVDIENYDQFGEAVEELKQQGAELIFVDTAGHSQFDEEKINYLKNVFEADYNYKNHLVLPATLPKDEIESVLNGFGQIGYDRLVVTKLDETRSYGLIYNLINELEEPISHFTNGQDVPHDLMLAEADHVADLLLGSES